jgi:hypothetical protein
MLTLTRKQQSVHQILIKAHNFVKKPEKTRKYVLELLFTFKLNECSVDVFLKSVLYPRIFASTTIKMSANKQFQ